MIIFDMIGSLIRDPDTWHLEEGDSEELSDRFVSWWRSIEGKKSAAWEKKLVKWQPALMLLMALGMIVGPRIEATISKRKNRHAVNIPPSKASGTSRAEPVAEAPAVAPYDGNPFRPDVKPVEKSQNGHGGVVTVSPAATGRPTPVVPVRLSREELRGFDPEDVT